MDAIKERFDRIAEWPGRATMDDVDWPLDEIERLQLAWKAQDRQLQRQADTIEFLQGEIVKWVEMAEVCQRELWKVRMLAARKGGMIPR